MGGTHLGEICILGQKPVTGVNRLAAGVNGSTYYIGNVKVTLARRCFTYANRLICHPYVQGTGIGLAVDRHGGNP